MLPGKTASLASNKMTKHLIQAQSGTSRRKFHIMEQGSSEC